MGKASLLYLTSEDWFFWSHRLVLARAAKAKGYDVFVACRVDKYAAAIEREGFTLVPLSVKRHSRNPVDALQSVKEIFRIYSRYRPDLVHHIGLQLSLFGTMAALLAKTPYIVNTFTGMGHLFVSRTLRTKLYRTAVLSILRLMNRSNVYSIVQNSDDLRLVRNWGVATPDRSILIAGAGVDIQRFAPGNSMHEDVATVVFVGRMLREKGIEELVAAARILQGRDRGFRIILVGEPDCGHPSSVSRRSLLEWDAEKIVEWWGHREDVPEILARGSIAVLPTYREGMSKFLLEAAACGLAIVTTDVPGCRDIIRHEREGLLVPPRDAVALADAIDRLIREPGLGRRLGENARSRVESGFSEQIVVDKSLGLYDALVRPSEAGPV